MGIFVFVDGVFILPNKITKYVAALSKTFSVLLENSRN
jgi:hypothetical protein